MDQCYVNNLEPPMVTDLPYDYDCGTVKPSHYYYNHHESTMAYNVPIAEDTLLLESNANATDSRSLYRFKNEPDENPILAMCDPLDPRNDALLCHDPLHPGNDILNNQLDRSDPLDQPHLQNMDKTTIPYNYDTDMGVQMACKNYPKKGKKSCLRLEDRGDDGGRKTFFCQDCGKSFKFQTSLLRHNNKVHNCKYQCPTCSRLFSRQAYLDVHTSKPGSSCFRQAAFGES